MHQKLASDISEEVDYKSARDLGRHWFLLDKLAISLPYSRIQNLIHFNNLEKANKASELIETGTVAVNTPVVAVAEAPFGGIKQTGYGREGGSMAIKDYLNIKYTHFGISY